MKFTQIQNIYDMQNKLYYIFRVLLIYYSWIQKSKKDIPIEDNCLEDERSDDLQLLTEIGIP